MPEIIKQQSEITMLLLDWTEKADGLERVQKSRLLGCFDKGSESGI